MAKVGDLGPVEVQQVGHRPDLCGQLPPSLKPRLRPPRQCAPVHLHCRVRFLWVDPLTNSRRTPGDALPSWDRLCVENLSIEGQVATILYWPRKHSNSHLFLRGEHITRRRLVQQLLGGQVLEIPYWLRNRSKGSRAPRCEGWPLITTPSLNAWELGRRKYTRRTLAASDRPNFAPCIVQPPPRFLHLISLLDHHLRDPSHHQIRNPIQPSYRI